MRKRKQIPAIIAIVLLAAMCIIPLILAITMPGSGWFKMSIAAVILIPVVLYAFLLTIRAVKPSKSPLIDTIVFDCGNVLVGFAWKKHMENLGFDEETIDYLEEHMIHDPLWNEFDRGVRSFSDVADEFCRENPTYEAEIRAFLEHPEDMIEEYSFSVPWLQDLKRAGYRLYVLSNWDEPCYTRLKDSVLRFEKYLDGAIWSYQHRCIKPEPEIYKKLIHKYNIDPTRAVFLDDTQKNLDAAKPFGFHTIHAVDHDAALAGLRALGVK